VSRRTARGARRADQFHRGDAALTSSTEAVTIHRQLAQANPAAHLPALATSLSTLSDRFADMSRPKSAGPAWLEAIQSLRNNLADRFTDMSRPKSAEPTWLEAIQSLRQPAARGELRVAWAIWLGRAGRSEEASATVRLAAGDADQSVSDNGPPERSAVVLAMRARRAVRSLVQSLPAPPLPNLPAWASVPITDQHRDLLDAYRAAADWPNRQASLSADLPLFTSSEFRAALTALKGLYPANPYPIELLLLLDEIDQSDIDTVFTAHCTDHAHRAVLTAWINTTTWSESQAYLVEHRDTLLPDRVLNLLADADDDVARQHQAILVLLTVLPDEQVYTLITDFTQTEDAALEAVEAGDLALLDAILSAAPDLARRPVTWGLAASVLLLAEGDDDRAYAHAQSAAALATPIQRRAHTIRLRALATQRPDLGGIDGLIAIFGTRASSG
jgi:hypothetical protein